MCPNEHGKSTHGKASTLDGGISNKWVLWNGRKNKVKIDKAKRAG